MFRGSFCKWKCICSFSGQRSTSCWDTSINLDGWSVRTSRLSLRTINSWACSNPREKDAELVKGNLCVKSRCRNLDLLVHGALQILSRQALQWKEREKKDSEAAKNVQTDLSGNVTWQEIKMIKQAQFVPFFYVEFSFKITILSLW